MLKITVWDKVNKGATANGKLQTEKHKLSSVLHGCVEKPTIYTLQFEIFT